MSERFECLIKTVVSIDVPRDQLWLCEPTGRTLEIAGQSVRVTEHYRRIGIIENIGENAPSPQAGHHAE